MTGIKRKTTKGNVTKYEIGLTKKETPFYLWLFEELLPWGMEWKGTGDYQLYQHFIFSIVKSKFNGA